MGVTIKGDAGVVITRWQRGVEITQADATYALERQKMRILERTARGVDVDGSPFAPYSTKGPYYYYPNGRVGTSKFSDRQNRAAASRLKRKLEASAHKNAAGEMRLTAKGIRFASYAAFKAWLGRSVVDLFGPRAPHMLQAMVVQITGQPVTEGRIGIYGEEAERASGHQYGTRHLPQRKFLGASLDDRELVKTDILSRIKARLKGTNGQS